MTRISWTAVCFYSVLTGFISCVPVLTRADKNISKGIRIPALTADKPPTVSRRIIRPIQFIMVLGLNPGMFVICIGRPLITVSKGMEHTKRNSSGVYTCLVSEHD